MICGQNRYYHIYNFPGSIAQLVRTLRCHGVLNGLSLYTYKGNTNAENGDSQSQNKVVPIAKGNA